MACSMLCRCWSASCCCSCCSCCCSGVSGCCPPCKRLIGALCAGTKNDRTDCCLCVTSKTTHFTRFAGRHHAPAGYEADRNADNDLHLVSVGCIAAIFCGDTAAYLAAAAILAHELLHTPLPDCLQLRIVSLQSATFSLSIWVALKRILQHSAAARVASRCQHGVRRCATMCIVDASLVFATQRQRS